MRKNDLLGYVACAVLYVLSSVVLWCTIRWYAAQGEDYSWSTDYILALILPAAALVPYLLAFPLLWFVYRNSWVRWVMLSLCLPVAVGAVCGSVFWLLVALVGRPLFIGASLVYSVTVFIAVRQGIFILGRFGEGD